MAEITLYFPPNYDRRLAPIPAKKLKQWWEDNDRTRSHAKHCLPLVMANCLGYSILSPGTFRVRWNGDTNANAEIEHIEQCSHYEVDNHAAFGSFCVQAQFVPMTKRPGDFIMVKGISNERGLPYSCMEACIEAWWNPARFGLVYLLNQPGEFMINMGQPIAQMFVLAGNAAASTVEAQDGYPPGYDEWSHKRSRKDYTKDLDYLHGRRPDGTEIAKHIADWKQVRKMKFDG